MAKFLPFVVASSTPLHIFQTLVTRSKGMNDVLVASIFYLVVDKGIAKVRESAKDIPDMDLDKVYETLITQYPSYRISNENYSRVQNLGDHIELWHPDTVSAELKDYGTSDQMIFLMVMAILKKLKDYTSLQIDKVLDGKSNAIMANLKKEELFSDAGEEYYFSSITDMQAYIECRALLPGDEDDRVVRPVKAVYYPATEGKKKKPNAKPSKANDKKSRTTDANGVPWDDHEQQYKEAQAKWDPEAKPKSPSDPFGVGKKSKFDVPDPRAKPTATGFGAVPIPELPEKYREWDAKKGKKVKDK